MVIAASPSAMELDYVAVGLVLLQVFLLYHIARSADALRGPRLLAAARAVYAKRSARHAAHAGERVVQLDTLAAAKRAMLERMRAAYVNAGGELDELWEPFLLRFLVGAEWNEANALQQLLPAARWRREHGASAIRRKCAGGWKLGAHPALARLVSSVGFTFGHRRTWGGDVISVGDIGSLDKEALFRQLSDDEFNDLCLHIFEFLYHHADRLSIEERYLVRNAVVLDYHGLAWRHLHPDIFFRLRPQVRDLNLYYPEFVGSATCLNVPDLFVHLYSVISPWLSEGLRKRMTTADIEQTRDVLAKLAPPSSLPGPYGGTCKTMPADVRQLLGLDSKPRSSLERMFGPGKLFGYASGEGQEK